MGSPVNVNQQHLEAVTLTKRLTSGGREAYVFLRLPGLCNQENTLTNGKHEKVEQMPIDFSVTSLCETNYNPPTCKVQHLTFHTSHDRGRMIK